MAVQFATPVTELLNNIFGNQVLTAGFILLVVILFLAMFLNNGLEIILILLLPFTIVFIGWIPWAVNVVLVLIALVLAGLYIKIFFQEN